MPTNIITGELILQTKQVKFSNTVPIVRGENRTTLLQVVIPPELRDYDIYFHIKPYQSKTITTPKLVVSEGKVEYLIINSALTVPGTVSFQIEANKEVGGEIKTYKSLVNQQLHVSGALEQGFTPEEALNIIADAQRIIDYTKSVGDELLLDKEKGMFKGDKGDPSTLDKIGAAVSIIDLSDIEQGVYGTIDMPILINENTTIQFNRLDLILGYQKSFILYIKRTAEVAVVWQNISGWAYGEIPLLPVGQVQKILVETSNAVNFYGTGGDCFDVPEL